MKEIVIRLGTREAAILLSAALLFGGGFATVSAFSGGATTQGLPMVLPYQGTLAKDGMPVDGTQPNVIFKLHDSEAGAVELWSSDSRTLDVKDGKFAVTLGDAHDTRQLQESFFREPALYVSINIDGTELSPRQRIAPAPQAIAAARAENGTPPGTIVAFAAASVPEGWLMCDGSARSSRDYPELAALLGSAWGTDFSSNCQSSTNTCDFELPELRGQFLRGAGINRGAVGTEEPGSTAMPMTTPFVTATGGQHDHVLHAAFGGDSGARAKITNGYSSSANPINVETRSSISMHNGHEHMIVGGDPETRPRNKAVNYIIKY